MWPWEPRSQSRIIHNFHTESDELGTLRRNSRSNPVRELNGVQERGATGHLRRRPEDLITLIAREPIFVRRLRGWDGERRKTRRVETKMGWKPEEDAPGRDRRGERRHGPAIPSGSPGQLLLSLSCRAPPSASLLLAAPLVPLSAAAFSLSRFPTLSHPPRGPYCPPIRLSVHQMVARILTVHFKSYFIYRWKAL